MSYPHNRLLITIVIILGVLSTSLSGCSLQDPLDAIYVDEIVYTETYWDDVRIPVNALRVPGSKAPSWVASYGTMLLSFSDQAIEANEEEVYFVIQIPHGYAEGTDIYFHVHFAFDTDTVGQHGIWGLEYVWVNNNELIGATNIIQAITPVTNNNSNTMLIAGFPAINGSGKKISSMILARLFRNSSSVTDTYTGAMVLLEIDAHYEINSPGSKEEYIK